ncbi:hypothetical protein D3C78_1960010 [compost metagenome]
MHLQGDAHESAEVAKAFGAGVRVAWGLGAQNLLAAALEHIAEVGPGLAAQQLRLDRVCRHGVFL